MTAHYFIGIQFPTLIEEIADTYTIKYNLADEYKVIPHPQDLHLTLLFMGAMREQELPLLTGNLQQIATKTPSFSMEMDGLSYFGSPKGPRVVYLSLQESKVLAVLQKEIYESVATLLDRLPTERFTPHITIAKKRKRTEPLFIQKEQWEPIKLPVTSFSLFTIHPQKSPKYEAVETFQLGGIPI